MGDSQRERSRQQRTHKTGKTAKSAPKSRHSAAGEVRVSPSSSPQPPARRKKPPPFPAAPPRTPLEPPAVVQRSPSTRASKSGVADTLLPSHTARESEATHKSVRSKKEPEGPPPAPQSTERLAHVECTRVTEQKKKTDKKQRELIIRLTPDPLAAEAEQAHEPADLDERPDGEPRTSSFLRSLVPGKQVALDGRQFRVCSGQIGDGEFGQCVMQEVGQRGYVTFSVEVDGAYLKRLDVSLLLVLFHSCCSSSAASTCSQWPPIWAASRRSCAAGGTRPKGSTSSEWSA